LKVVEITQTCPTPLR
jgi:hypothetical protein